MATEDLCLVCADALDYTGFGPCGHKDACSRCVARLRFVMEDTKCMICKQDNPQVFFTRYMGDYTDSLAPDEFVELPSRARAGEVYELPEVNGYFDDQDHYKTIKALCSYTHPILPNATFGNLTALKRKLQDLHKLQMCDLCVKGRKVFISEQVLYTKADLEKHMRTGDDEGPLAESGFKGHPSCRFCRQRFYDGDELYKHMEGRHEHCFICRKRQPHKFIYYKDYSELEEHFQAQHHPCPHPNCLERKFVVFAEEPELKRHFATEHGSEMNMSRAQRRNLLTVNIQLNYAREQEEAQAAAAVQRPGIVIGGGHNLPRRGGMRHSRSEGAMAAAVQASIESSQVENAMRQSAAEGAPSSVTFSAEDFPSVSGQGRSGAAPLGTWVGASGPSGGASLAAEDFPALPTMSRNQRRKQRERERSTAATLAGRLAAAGAPIRVVNRAAPAGSSISSSAAAAASSSSSSSATGLVRHSSSTGNLPAAAAAAAAAAASADEQYGDGLSEVDDTPAGHVDEFPALPGGGPATQAHPAWVPVRRTSKPPRTGQAANSSRAAAAAPPGISDFPSLAATTPAQSRQAGSKLSLVKKASTGTSSSSSGKPSVAAAVAAAGGVSEELKAANKALIERCRAALSEQGFTEFRQQSGAFMQGCMSAGSYHAHVVQLGLTALVPQLAALCPDANKRAALIAAHKDFLETAQDNLNSAAGGRGWVPPEAAMAALQEVEQKGSWACEHCTLINAPSSRACEVCSAPKPKPGSAAAVSAAKKLAAGKSSSSSAASAPQSSQWQSAAGAASSSSNASSNAGTSVPIAAKLRASTAAAQPSTPPAPATAEPARTGESWPSLAGPSSGRSSASDGGSSSAAAAAAQPQQLDTCASSASPPQSQSGKKKKPQKTSLQELLTSGKTHPQNAWTQQQRLTSVVAAPTGGRASMGQWGKQGGAKLKKKMNDNGFLI